jgi:hypothetical protein
VLGARRGGPPCLRAGGPGVAGLPGFFAIPQF